MLSPEELNRVLRETLDNYIRQGIFQGKEVVIFGCSSTAPDIIDHLRLRGVRMVCCIDNDKSKEGKLFRGLRIYRPDDYLRPHKDKAVILIPPLMYGREMAMQAMDLGYSEDTIIQLEDVQTDPADDSAEALEEQLEAVARGVDVYERLCGSSERNIFICQWEGIGDVYSACSFLSEYLKKKRINDYMVTVIKMNSAEAAKLLGVENIAVISREESDALLLAWQFLGSDKIHAKPLFYYGWRTKKHFYNFKFDERISFADYFKYDVFELEAESKPKRPQHRPNDTYCKTLFEQLGLEKNQTIIIAPHGSFRTSIKTPTWEELVSILRHKGYCVCTNCYGDEQPIPGTVKIQFPISEALNVAEYSGGVISIRSGLCDVLSGAKCKLTVIYEHGIGGAAYDFFSLKKMGFRDQISEIIYDDPAPFLEAVGKLY